MNYDFSTILSIISDENKLANKKGTLVIPHPTRLVLVDYTRSDRLVRLTIKTASLRMCGVNKPNLMKDVIKVVQRNGQVKAVEVGNKYCKDTLYIAIESHLKGF